MFPFDVMMCNLNSIENQQIVQTCSCSHQKHYSGRYKRSFIVLRLFYFRTQRRISLYTPIPRSYSCPYTISNSYRSPLKARQNYSTSAFGTIESLSLQINRTESVFGIFLKCCMQSQEKRGSLTLYSISFFRKYRSRLTKGLGSPVYLSITLRITASKHLKGLSNTNLSTIL